MEIWKTNEARQSVLARYAQILDFWPVANTRLHLSTSQGETFVIASGPEDAPAVLLLHGSMANTTSWMGDVLALSQHFRVFALDMIGEPGLSAPSRPPLASDLYAKWLDEVLAGLGVERVALVGISLGGWLALDYATRRGDKVSAMALLCPGGVGATKNVLLWAAPLLLLGAWGRRRVMQRLGAGALAATNSSPAAKAFAAFTDLIQTHFIARREALPRFSDGALKRLEMPVLAILGAKDALLNSFETRERLGAHVARLDLRWLPSAGHFLIGHGAQIDEFLATALLR